MSYSTVLLITGSGSMNHWLILLFIAVTVIAVVLDLGRR